MGASSLTFSSNCFKKSVLRGDVWGGVRKLSSVSVCVCGCVCVCVCVCVHGCM